MVCVKPRPFTPQRRNSGTYELVHKNRPGSFGVKINLFSLPEFKQRIIIPDIIKIIFLKKYIKFAK
jgi:hypothetical protein